jgi:hypothetical protein
LNVASESKGGAGDAKESKGSANNTKISAANKSQMADGKSKSSYQEAISAVLDIEERRTEAKLEEKGSVSLKQASAEVVSSKKELIRGDGYRLLGDLPSLEGGKANSNDIKVRFQP